MCLRLSPHNEVLAPRLACIPTRVCHGIQDEDAQAGDLQRQRHRHAPAAPARVAAGGAARCRRAAGTQGDRRSVSRGCAGASRLRRGLAGAALVEWRGAAGPRRRAGGEPARPAGRCEGRPESLHRGGNPRHRRRRALSAQRQSAAGSEIRLQAALDGAVAQTRADAGRVAASGGVAGRFQCHPDRCGRLRHEGLPQGRADAAGGPRGVRRAARPGLDGRAAPRGRRRADLHVLGLLPAPRRTRPRPAHRSPAVESGVGQAAQVRGRGPLGAPEGKGQRPRAHVDRGRGTEKP